MFEHLPYNAKSYKHQLLYIGSKLLNKSEKRAGVKHLGQILLLEESLLCEFIKSLQNIALPF